MSRCLIKIMDERKKSGNQFMDEAFPVLKEIVDKNGVEYLHKKPYSVYTKLKSRKMDLRVCRLLVQRDGGDRGGRWGESEG